MGVSSVNQVLESNGKRVLEMTLALENALLTQERNELASALDSVGDAVCILDLFGNIIYVNRAFEEMYGYAQGEVQGHEHIQILIPADPSSEVLAKDAFDGGTNRVWKGEVRRIHKDGTILDVLLTVTPLKNHAGEDIGRIGVSRSIVTSKELEWKLWDNEERTKAASGLSSLGELAAGVAHEIINPLAGILSLSDLIMTEILSGQVFDDVRKINWEAQRAKRVAQSLVSFARNRDPVKLHLDVINTLKEILESKAHSFRINNIQLRTEWAKDIPRTMVDEHQLGLAILNILTNAEQAMLMSNGGGKLFVGVSESDGKIKITITDDGPGISPAHLLKICDLFFTTKPLGEGSGLGLSICDRIIRQHDGQLQAESVLGEGSTFHIWLPIRGDMVNC